MIKTAQGDVWELGVAVRVKNHSFRFPTWYADTLDAATVSGQKSIHVLNASDELQSVAIGDYVTIGPNSSGVTEVAKVAAISSRTGNSPFITAVDNLSNSFAAYDADYPLRNHVTGVVSNLAGAWSVGTTEAIPGGVSAIRGKDDRFCQMIQFAGADDELKQTLDDDEFIADTTFRVGCHYKQSANDFYLQVHDGTSAFINKTCGDTTDAWVSVTDTGDSVDGTISDSYIRFFYKGASTFYVDCVFLEHDSGIGTAGYYTFTERPDLDSLSWGMRGFSKQQELLDSTLRKFTSMGLEDQIRKYTLSAHFSNVGQTFWNNLMIFKEWQDRGRLLCLHPNIDDLPEVLIGYMQIVEDKQISKNFWNFAYRSFDFVFIEA